MRTLKSRVAKLEEVRQRAEARKTYRVASDCGRVVATIVSYKTGPVASVRFPFPALNADDALTIIADQLPARCYVTASADRLMSVEEWQDWCMQGGHRTTGSPFLCGVIQAHCTEKTYIFIYVNLHLGKLRHFAGCTHLP